MPQATLNAELAGHTAAAGDFSSAIRVRSLSHSYGARRALAGVDFDVSSGELFGILGPNGGGKSTTFRILATLLIPDGGNAWILGHDVVRERDAVRQLIGVAFQSPALDIKLSVRENLMHHGHLYGLSGSALRERMEDALVRTGLTERRAEMAESLSGGLRRRLELAKALLTHPAVLLLDEPTVGLDPRAREEFWRLVNELRQSQQMTVVATTHLLEEAAGCDRIAILDEGTLVGLGSPAELCHQIEGEVITLRGPGVARRLAEISAEFGLVLQGEGESWRGVTSAGHDVAARLADRLGNDLESVSVARPTLADVFRQKTGHGFAEAGQDGQ